MTAHDPPHGRLVTSMRFYRLPDVAEIFNISDAQAYALVRTGELPAIKVGGRGQWRVEREEVDAYIARNYSETRTFIQQHPFGTNTRDDDDRLSSSSEDDLVDAALSTQEELVEPSRPVHRKRHPRAS